MHTQDHTLPHTHTTGSGTPGGLAPLRLWGARPSPIHRVA
jgi:hypothetical protein